MNREIDPNVVIGRLQQRLGEAFTLISMLEAQVEVLLAELEGVNKEGSES